MTHTWDIKLAAVTTVSQLLNASDSQFSTTTVNSTNYLTQTLQNFSWSSGNEGSQLVQPNLAIQSLKLNTDGISVVQFTAVKDSKNKPKVDTVGFVLYNNDQFFGSEVFKDSLGTKRRVISGNLGVENVPVAVQFNINNSIQFNRSQEENQSSMSIQDFACVFWDYKLGDWSTEGCIKVTTSFNSSNSFSGSLACRCNHTTNFAVLMSFSSNFKYSEALGVISIVGCALSVAGLVITVLFQILTRNSRGVSPTLLMVNICVSMTIFYLLFIFGINNPVKHTAASAPSQTNSIPPSDFHREADQGPCTAMAALLQYFLLATFTWSTLYAAHIFFVIKNAISGPPENFNTISIITGWGFPAVIVGISLGATYRPDKPLNYRQEEFCWLAALTPKMTFDVQKPMFWGFLLPLALMIFFNIAVLFYFALITCRTNQSLNSSRVPPFRKKLLSSVSLAVVLGISWIIGYFMLLSVDPIQHNILTYAFCLCNTTQGVQIFVLFTVRTKIFKEKFSIFRRSIPSPEVSVHRMSYHLWPLREKDLPENYRSADFDQQVTNHMDD
ncbi:hypothetical protein MHYP_G00300520 [Metynnis hypsauchen]